MVYQVEFPPEFIRRLESVQVKENSSIKLCCTIRNEHKFNVKWFCNQKEITENERFSFINNEKAGIFGLWIRNVQQSDEAAYQCKAYGPTESASSTCYLTVKAKKVPSRRSRSLSPSKKETSKRMRYSPLRFIVIKPPSLEDVEEEPDQTKEDMTVDSFQFEEHPAEVINIEEGGDVHLKCAIKGSSLQSLDWYKDGVKLSEDSRIDIYTDRYSHHLTICKAYTQDSGIYTIKATDGKKVIKFSTQLKVTPNAKMRSKPLERENTLKAPFFVTKPRNVVVHEGKSIKVTCQVEGYPKPTVTWYKSGIPISSESKYHFCNSAKAVSIELKNSSIFDTGEYACYATNSVGSAYCAFNITVEAMTETDTSEIEETPKCTLLSDQDSYNDVIIMFKLISYFY